RCPYLHCTLIVFYLTHTASTGTYTLSLHDALPILVLACSAIETARQLLINGLANGSGQVGRNLTSHFGVTVIGVFPELKNRDASNDDGTAYYHSLLTGLYWDKPNPNFEGTYQVQCGSGLHPHSMMIRNLPGYGLTLKRALREKNISH